MKYFFVKKDLKVDLEKKIKFSQNIDIMRKFISFKS